MAFTLAVIAAVIAVPLLFAYRSADCRSSGGHVEARWRFSLPGHQKRLRRCDRPEQGLHYVLRKVGLT
jgi:hypothetical protein